MVAMGLGLNSNGYLTAANAAGSCPPRVSVPSKRHHPGLTAAGVSSSSRLPPRSTVSSPSTGASRYWLGHEVHGEEGSDLSVSFPGLRPWGCAGPSLHSRGGTQMRILS